MSEFLCIPDVDDRVAALVYSGLAVNSRKSYSAALKKYIEFCRLYSLSPLNFDEVTVLRTVAHLAARSLALSTIRVYLSGIRAWFISMGRLFLIYILLALSGLLSQ